MREFLIAAASAIIGGCIAFGILCLFLVNRGGN